jgi:hypothetical protein
VDRSRSNEGGSKLQRVGEKLYIEKHLWAMSNLTKEEKRLEILKETGVPTIPLQEVEAEDPMMGVARWQEIEENDEMTLEQLTGNKKREEEAHVLVASFMGGDTTLLEGDQPAEPEDEDGDKKPAAKDDIQTVEI